MPKICGVLPVLEALRAGGREIDHIVIVKGAKGPKVGQVLEAAQLIRVPIRRQPREALDHLAGNSDHQGVIAITSSASSSALKRFFNVHSQDERGFITFPFYFLGIMALLHYYIYGIKGVNVPVLLIGCLVVTAPAVWHRVPSLRVVGLTCAFSAAGSWFLGFNFRYFALPIACLTLAVFLVKLVINWRLEYRKWPEIVATLFFAYLAFDLLLRPYRSDRWPEDGVYGILSGHTDPDILYHMAISHMTFFEHLPSIGAHGVLYRNFHILQHIVQAILMGSTGQLVYQNYFQAITLVIFPFYLLCLAILLNLFKSRYYFVFLPLVFFGLCPEDVINRDESNVLSYAISCIFYYLLVKDSSVLYVAPVVLLGFLAKNATGLALGLVYVFFQLFKKGDLKKRALNVGLGGLAAWLGYRLTGVDYGGKPISFEPWATYNYFTQSVIGAHSFTEFLTIEYGIGLLALAFIVPHLVRRLFFQKKPIRANANLILLSLLGVFAYSVSVIDLKFPGPTAGHVMSVANWLLMPFLLLYIGYLFESTAKTRHPLGIVLLVILAIALVPTQFRLLSDRVTKYPVIAQHRAEAFQQPVSRVMQNYFAALHFIEQTDAQRQYVVEVDRSDNEFWNFVQHWTGPAYTSAFLIPVLSGRPGWNSYDPKTMYSDELYWGYSSYAYGAPHPESPCGVTKYQGIFKVRRTLEDVQDRDRVVVELFRCGDSGPSLRREF